MAKKFAVRCVPAPVPDHAAQYCASGQPIDLHCSMATRPGWRTSSARNPSQKIVVERPATQDAAATRCSKKAHRCLRVIRIFTTNTGLQNKFLLHLAGPRRARSAHLTRPQIHRRTPTSHTHYALELPRNSPATAVALSCIAIDTYRRCA